MKRLSEEALDVLESGVVLSGKELRITRPLDRKLYVEINAALEAIGGKWNRKAKVHLFDEEPADALDQVLVDGGFHDKKRDLNQFFTPPEFAKHIVALADVRGRTVLEPSAGAGALARACLDAGASSVHCFEIDPKYADVLRAFGKVSLSQLDFLGPTPLALGPAKIATFERVVMNPPFARQQDIVHATHAFSFLRPGGRLVAIMAAGVEFRQDRRAEAFRQLVRGHGGSIKRNPEGTFSPSGTDVNTVTVVIDKPRSAK